ncbi:hypothetical protein JCM24511_06552 [Saitozyma sp. JCM 24511]|nr:hypothetical protein JCM24511_06552 [Saitozyma sp. JCM 24511]
MSGVHGNISHAMRDNYAEFGVDEYYRKVSASYRNPFFEGIKKVVWTLMNRWWEEEGRELYTASVEHGGLRVLDMAAGSGEATLVLLEWERLARGITTAESSTSANPPASTSLIPPLPLPPGSTTPTPSRPAFVPPNARRGLPPPSQSQSNAKKRGIFANSAPHRVPRSFPPIQVTATDPYTSPAYTERTSRPCHPLSFNSLSASELPPNTQPDSEGVVWDMIFCSFALHLVPPQELFPLCYELATKARWLVVIAPHKKPELKETWGWTRWDMASWKPAGDKLYRRGGRGDQEDDDEETELEIVRDK